jgi:hypothetical protein
MNDQKTVIAYDSGPELGIKEKHKHYLGAS